MSTIRNINLNLSGFKLNISEFEIPDEGVTAIRGKSGAGKTTLLNVLVGLEECQKWTWIFNDVDLALLPPAERRLGIVFQSYDLFPHLTSEENIMLVANSRYSNREELNIKKAEIENLKNRLNLNSCWHTPAEKLSGGEKQRVAFLRAVFSNPRIIILDEPFSALDESLRAESRKILKEIIFELKIPVLLVTHDQNDVDVLADRVVELENGQIKIKL